MRYQNGDRRTGGRTDLIVLLILLSCGALAASLDGEQQLRMSAAVRGTVLWPVLEVHELFAERSRVAERLERVTLERDMLAREVLASRQAAEEGRQLRRISTLAPDPPGDLLAANLLPGRPRIGDADVFVLRGRGLETVGTPTAVLAGDRLVGVLRAVEPSGALGEFWSHPDFRVSVRTPDGAVTGIVRPLRPEDGPPVMVLDGAPYQNEIVAGTPLFTSGLSGIYPPGVWVGTVRELWGVESGWTRSYLVEPAIRPEAADVVLVWRRTTGEGL